MVEEASSKAVKLVVRDSGSQEHYDLRGETITLGRAHDNSLPLEDPRASRHHCKIEF
ncbi:MAG: pSer/pThr/pTyr-binding forkhead associated (FHA) protein, partial [Planctomycetota bacterium]